MQDQSDLRLHVQINLFDLIYAAADIRGRVNTQYACRVTTHARIRSRKKTTQRPKCACKCTESERRAREALEVTERCLSGAADSAEIVRVQNQARTLNPRLARRNQ